jgi:hypothetical protein
MWRRVQHTAWFTVFWSEPDARKHALSIDCTIDAALLGLLLFQQLQADDTCLQILTVRRELRGVSAPVLYSKSPHNGRPSGTAYSCVIKGQHGYIHVQHIYRRPTTLTLGTDWAHHHHAPVPTTLHHSTLCAEYWKQQERYWPFEIRLSCV